MKRFISLSLAAFITICMIVGTERRAFAYVDPGTGLIALQTIASVIAAYTYMVRRKILAFFGSRKDPVALPSEIKPGDRPT